MQRHSVEMPLNLKYAKSEAHRGVKAFRVLVTQLK